MSEKPKLAQFCADLVVLHHQATQLGLTHAARIIEQALSATMDEVSAQVDRETDDAISAFSRPN
ncbi:MAG: hypothetical protein AAFR28_13520 [Pseudomonadota bacterium]